MKLIEALKDLPQEESGQDLIEYALMGALIALASVAAMNAVATDIGTVFGKLEAQFT